MNMKMLTVAISISMDANQGLEANEVVDYLGEATTEHRDF